MGRNIIESYHAGYDSHMKLGIKLYPTVVHPVVRAPFPINPDHSDDKNTLGEKPVFGEKECHYRQSVAERDWKDVARALYSYR